LGNQGLVASTDWWISMAALMARIASSSCALGIPKTAITESPTYLSIKPSYLAIMSEILSKIRVMIFLTVSGSSFSVIAVYPERSEKRTVTCFRSRRTEVVRKDERIPSHSAEFLRLERSGR
jgi:hypothetical protein